MISGEHGRMFWAKLKDTLISKKQGCYVFALRAGRGATPWYVGKAGKSFQQECFGSHKLIKYNTALFAGRVGSPVLYFVALPGKKKKISAKILSDLETYLIRVAKDSNPKLLNKINTKPPKWGIAHVVRSGQGKLTKGESSFRKMLDL